LRTYFSKRHEKSLNEKRLKPQLATTLRVAILRTLTQHSTFGGDWGEDNVTFYAATETLKTFYGSQELQAYSEKGKLEPSNFEGVIQSGWPPRSIDCIEAWLDHASKASARDCEKELNEILEIHKSSWRFVNGTAMLIDSQYLHEHVTARVVLLMRENAISGALEEFNAACSYLTEQRNKEAVVSAHKSVESVMKSVLSKPTAKFGELVAGVIKSNIVPAYYQDFLFHFEKFLLAAAKERNQPGRGHGQGAEVLEVDFQLAEFAVNLAGAINLFLIKCWLDQKSQVPEKVNMDDEEIPF
jgi:hypothetical protein